MTEAPSTVTPATNSVRIPRRAWADILVLSALSMIGIVGYETSFGDDNFLIAGVGGLLVGTGAAILATILRLGVVTATLGAVVAYFVLGTPFTMPGEGFGFVVPSLQSLAGLALGAVHGWADIVTVQTPVEAPYYTPVVPYVATWLVAFVGTMLLVRWLPQRRTVVRASVLLIGPALIYLSGILLGTDEAYLAGVRGIAFAVIALLWVGWRRSTPGMAEAGRGRLLRQKLIGSGVVVVGAVVAGAVAGAALAPAPPARFVLREEIVPPFDPFDFPSPLSGFREYTKVLAETPLFEVNGVEPGDVIRLASMDTYSGKLWNVAGPEDTGSGEGGFAIVGSTLPAPPLATIESERSIEVSVSGYDDVWLPGVGYARHLDFHDDEAQDRAGDLRYNAASGTAVLTSGLDEGNRYSIEAQTQSLPDPTDLRDVPVANLNLPAIDHMPDVVVAKAVEFSGDAETPIEKLQAIEQALKTQGFLSHGLASDAIASRAGHGADRMIELFTRSQMVGDEEQYASAMALMARYLGYPARVVMGFAPEISEDAERVEVVGDDVTAWVEVAFEDVGWIPFYPTPEQTDVPQDQTPKPKSEPQPQVRQPPRSENQEDDLLTAVEIDDSDDEDRNEPYVIPAWVWVVAGVIGIPLLLIFAPMLVITALKARRRRRRLSTGAGDRRVAGAWEELVDRYAELGLETPQKTTRRQLAVALERQLSEQALGEVKHQSTDTGPIRVVEPETGAGSAPPSSGIRLVPLATEIDRAVFNGADIDDTEVERQWSAVDESVGIAYGAAGRVRRFISRFRIRSRRPTPPHSRDRAPSNAMPIVES